MGLLWKISQQNTRIDPDFQFAGPKKKSFDDMNHEGHEELEGKAVSAGQASDASSDISRALQSSGKALRNRPRMSADKRGLNR